MDQINNKQAFRSEVVLKLIDHRDLTTDEVITSAKKIEDYVFQEQLTYIVEDENDRKSLDLIAKGFLSSGLEGVLNMNNKFLGVMLFVQVLTLSLICASVNFSNWFPISALWISGILIGISIGEILQEHEHKCNKTQNS